MSAKKGKNVNKSATKYLPQQKSSSTSTYVLGGIAIVVIAAVVIFGVIWQSHRNKPKDQGYGGIQNSAVQMHVGESGVVKLGVPNAPKSIDLFEDPMCPACGQFENQYGQEVAKAIDGGKIAVTYHLLNFLDRGSHSGDYSTRADAAASAIAQSGDAKAYFKFHSALFSPEHQPKEGSSSDPSNEQLADLAKDSGASDDVAKAISSGSGVKAASANAEAGDALLTKLGGKGTPSVFQGTTSVDVFQDRNWISNLK